LDDEDTQTIVSLNSRLESNKEEEDTQTQKGGKEVQSLTGKGEDS